RLVEHLMEVARLRAGARRTGEHQEAGDDLLDPVQLLDDVLQILTARVVVLELRAYELDRRADPGERVADLVGDVGRQLAERHEPVDLLLELAVLVAEGQRLGLERQVAALRFEAEVATLAGRALQPARLRSREQLA